MRTLRNKELNKHFFEGGTAVTNFDPSQLSIFEEAIKRYNDDSLRIEKNL